MKRKTMALILALSMCLSILSACGGDSAQNTGKPPASNSTPSTTEQQPAESNKPEESKKPTEGEPDESAEPTQQEPESSAGPKPAVPAEMTYTFDAATGTLTCSGGGEVEQGAWIDAVKNALFETDKYVCMKEIKKVIIEKGVTAIGKLAFKDCENLIEVTIPDSVVSIGDGAFSETSLSSVHLPDSITTIGVMAFAQCENLQSATLPSHLAEIPKGLFSKCKNLTSIQIPDGVTSIGEYAFEDTGLTEITIPDSVITLGSLVFARAPIKELTIPASVTSWDNGPCREVMVSDVTFLCEATMDNVESLVYGLLYAPVTIHAPAGSVIEGYINRQIQNDQSVTCTFAPIN